MALLSRRGMIFGGLGTLTLVSASAYGVSTMLATAAGQEMTPPEVLDAVTEDRVLLVDIRRPDEWQKTGIAKGAIPIDMRRDDFATAVLAARAFAAQPVALICARGVRSRRMTVLLDEAGIAPIIDVPEGMLGSFAGPGWLKRDLPVVAWNA